MFKRVLIANRGEIAVRVIRACKELGIETIAVYSTADESSLHTKFADHAICIGPPPSAQSYLNITSIISAAEVSGADAIHPGYGFLAENANFAEACEASNIIFIGPSPEAINSMGNKSNAKSIVKANGVPVISGSNGAISDEREITKIAESISFPLMIKASSGGGGKGMRIAQNKKELVDAVRMAKAEAGSAFGNEDIYLEKYIAEPRHIEVQILGDKYGNIIHFGERDCSIQRRHQKLIEEAPSVIMTEEKREVIGKAAIKCAEAVNYVGAGTVEFLMDNNGDFYFMEMNTRIQVEHPITEMVAECDLVKEQIRIAAGERVERCNIIHMNGHAIEFRINAEDPDNQFLPSPGKIDFYIPAGGPGVRVDSHIYPGYEIPPFYDSLIAKLIIWGKDRDEALQRSNRALSEFIITGIKTTIPFHQKVINNAFFINGDYYTNFIARRIELADE